MILSTKTALAWFWANTPWYVKWVFAVIVVPNLMVNLAIVLVWGIPWLTYRIEASSLTVSQTLENKILNSIEKQTLINQNMNENILRMERHQSLFMSAVLNNNSRQNKNEP